MELLRVEGLKVKYKDFELNVPFLSLEDSEVVGIIGRNASGKTTFIKAIIGDVRYEGKVYFEGRLAKNMPLEEFMRFWGYVPQELSFPFPFEVDYVLELVSRRFDTYEELKRLRQSVLPKQMLHRRVTELSFGHMRLLALAMVYLKPARIALIDEPFIGLDRWNKRRALNLIGELKEKGMGVLVVTHDLETLNPDRVHLMQQFSNRRINISVLK